MTRVYQHQMSGHDRAGAALVAAACRAQAPAVVDYDTQASQFGFSHPIELTHTSPKTSRPFGVGALFPFLLGQRSFVAVSALGAGVGAPPTHLRRNSLPSSRRGSCFRKQPADFIFGRARHLCQDLIEPLHNHRLSLSSVCSRAGSNNASKHGQDHGKGTRELGSFTQGIFSTSKRGEASDD